MVDNLFFKRRCLKTREKLLRKTIPFRFTKIYESMYIDNTNCYAYLFNEFIPFREDERFSYLGWTQYECKAYYSAKEAEKMMLLDLKNLGFKVRKLRHMPRVRNNRLNFAFFVGITAGKPDGDFHFVRQNINGSWSQKLGYEGRVDYFRNLDGKICPPHKSDYEEVRFIGYYQAWKR